MADRLHDVDRQPFRFDQREILGHRCPALAESRCFVERRGRGAFAGVNRGDALREQVEGGAGIVDHGRGRLSHHVDKAGRNDQPRRINLDFRLFSADAADADDLAVGDADVGHIPRRAGAIDDPAAANDDIELLISGAGDVDRGEEQQQGAEQMNGEFLTWCDSW